jgi:HSP90 family molecular chaperone
MLPGDLKDIFGLKDQKDLNMANNIWKMLDDMANSDPDQYKKFIDKNMKEGFEDAKQKKEEKEKPFKVKPHPGFCINMTANLNEKPLESPLN